MLTSCVTTALRAQNFEHLTQAATGATSGDWLVKFCKSSVSRCSRVESTWTKLSAQLAASRDAKGMPRINVATVDTTDSGWLTKCLGRSRRPPLPPLFPWWWPLRLLCLPSDVPGGSRRPSRPRGAPDPLSVQSLPRVPSSSPRSEPSPIPLARRRFGITSVPVVLLFKGGVMYSFHGGGFSVERLMQFAERDYVHSSRMLVPPEPHVATPHDQTFLSRSRLIRPLGSG